MTTSRRRAQEGSSSAPVYQIKVALRQVRPAVWRRLLVRSDITLSRLHKTLQIAMGWTDTHLYEFTTHGSHFGELDDDAPPTLRSARGVRLAALLVRPRSRLLYEYDFGDGWQHDVVLERILAAEAGQRYPMCVAGKRACPPEDCAGPYGYVELLDAITDPEHDRHEELTDWVGGAFDPEEFAVDLVNAQFRRYLR